MTHKISLKLLFFTTILLQLSFQQNPNFLSNIIQNVDEATIGYGNQGVIITNEGGNTLDDSLFNFQAVDFEGLGPEEWTVQWTDTEGEAFDLIDENGQILAVGPDSTEDVTDQIASTANIQPAAVSGLIGTLAEDVVQEVDKNGGNMTLTGNQAYSKAVLPVTLAVLGAQSATETVKSGLDQAGNTVKDAAETVGDKASDVANDAWQDTKNAADTVADKASDIGSAIADKATELGENISDGAKDAWEDTKNVADTVGDKVTDAANTVADKATEFGEDVADAAKDAWNGTKDVADKVGDAVGNAVDSLKDGISSLFGN